MINIIAAVGKNLELGKDGDLIWRIPNDLKYFKKITNNHVVVMGRRTFESLGKSLPNRTNIVITHKNLEDKNVIVVSDYNKMLNMNDDIFIIGGESIYKLFLPYADNLYLTEIEDNCRDADTYFPNFDKDLYDREVFEDEEYETLKYSYVRYRKK